MTTVSTTLFNPYLANSLPPMSQATKSRTLITPVNTETNSGFGSHFSGTINFLIKLCGLLLVATALSTTPSAQPLDTKKTPTSHFELAPQNPQKVTPLLFGHYAQWSIYSPNVRPHQLPLELLDVLIYNSADIDEQGLIKIHDSFADIEHLTPEAEAAKEHFYGNFAELAAIKRQQPKLITLISIGGWGLAEHFRRIGRSQKNYQDFAKSVFDFCERYYFDGVELDWATLNTEHQGPEFSDIKHLTRIAQSLKALAQERDNNFKVAINLPNIILHGRWQGHELSRASDWLILQTEQLAGTWNTKTRHLSPLKDSESHQGSVSTMLKRAVFNGLETNKMIIGVAPFAMAWKGVEPANQGLKSSFEAPSWGSWDSQQQGATGVYNRKKLAKLLRSNNYEHHWDAAAKVPWLYSSTEEDGHFISFENKRSVQEKINLVNNWPLAGLSVRQLHNDRLGTESLTFQAFTVIHPWRGSAFWFNQQWLRHKKALLWWLAGLAIAFILAGGLSFQWRRHQRQRQHDKQQFKYLQRWLRALQWQIDNSISLINPSSLGKVFGGNVSALININVPLLAKSKLGQDQSLYPESLMLNIELKLWQHRLNQETIALNIANIRQYEHCRIHSDSIALAEFFDHLGRLALKLNQKIGGHTNTQSIQGRLNATHQAYIELMINAHNANKSSYRIIKSLYLQAEHLGLLLDLTPQSICIKIPLEKNIQQPSGQLSVTSKKVSNQTESTPTTDIRSATLKDSDSNNNQSESTTHPLSTRSKTSQQEASNSHKPRVQNQQPLSKISQSLSSTRDLQQQLLAVEAFFDQEFGKSIELEVSDEGLTPRSKGTETLAKDSTEERCFSVSGQQVRMTGDALTAEQQSSATLLIGQIQGLRQSLQQLMQQPSLLSELHKLAQHRDCITHIKADAGYSAVFLKDQPEPFYLTLRLKTIGQYFSRQHLIQIHRSYLVNPQTVLEAKAKGRINYQLVTEKENLPISRGYIKSLQKSHPHWFNAR